jgi:electron transfer flavoprotein alpha subunit
VILVIAEQRDGVLNRASLETIAAAQALAGGEPIAAAVLGADVGKAAETLAGSGVAEVFAVQHSLLAPYTPDATTAAVIALIDAVRPAVVLLPHTYQTRDFAPVVSLRAGLPLITDVVAVRGPATDAVYTRPMFQGKLAAEVKAEGAGPAIVTIQIGAFRADAVVAGATATITPVEAAVTAVGATTVRQKPEAPFQEAKQAVDLSQAERIVSVGRGIKSQEHLPLVEALAKAMGAEVAASRPICDSGWLPMDRQIGSSGQTVAPKLYVALGISGAIQHLVGMKGSRTIVAINKDAEAPIFEVADIGVVGDLFEIVPALVAELQKT